MGASTPSRPRNPHGKAASSCLIAAAVWTLPYLYYVGMFSPPENARRALGGPVYYGWYLLQLALTIGVAGCGTVALRRTARAASRWRLAGLLLLCLLVSCAWLDDWWRLYAIGPAHRRLPMHQQPDALSVVFFHWRSPWHVILGVLLLMAAINVVLGAGDGAPRWKEWLVRAGLACGSMLACLLVLEVALRAGVFGDPWVAYRGGTEIYRLNLLTGWSYRENVVSEMVAPEFRVQVRINSAGCRDAEYAYARTHGLCRILCLGDSFTFGVGVPDRKRFSELLEHRLLSGVEVVNAGVVGYGTDQEYLYLAHEGWRYHPDLVILNFTASNDMLNNTMSSGVGFPKPYFELEAGELQLRPIVAKQEQSFRKDPEPFSFGRFFRVPHYLRRQLYAVREVRRLERAVGTTEDETRVALPATPPSQIEWLSSPQVAVRPKGFHVTYALMSAIARECTRIGAKLLVLIVPAWEVTTPPPDPVTEIWLDKARGQRAARDICQSLGIPWVDALESETRLRAQGRAVRWKRDPHWTPLMHMVAARLLADKISTARLLPDTCLQAATRH